MINPRPYQTAAIQALANADLGYLEAQAGSGKSVCMAYAVKMKEVAKMRPLKTVILAPTKEIRDQMVSAFGKVGVMGEVIGLCWQGLDAVPECDVLIVDEVHGVAAPEYKKLLRSTLYKKDGRWMRRCVTLGCTATPIRGDEEPIEPIIGPCLHKVSRDDIRQAKGVLQGKYIVARYNDPESAKMAIREASAKTRHWMDDTQASRVLWQAVLKHCVTQNQKRCDFIAELAGKYSDRSVIVLLDTVAQCKRVASGLHQAVAFYSGMGDKKRRESLEDFRDGRVKIMVATAIADMGLDAPIASVLIMGRASKSKAWTEQRVGRVLRPYPGQDHGLVVDICDSAHKMLEIQHYQRLRLYKKWGFVLG